MRRFAIIIKHKSVIIRSLLVCLTLIYMLLDMKLVLDRSNTTLGEYDFGPMQTEAALLVEGTGIQSIKDQHTITELKVIEIRRNIGQLPIKTEVTIKVNEYLDVIDNKRVYGIPVPGKSTFGMGTGYKPINKKEERIVHIFRAKDTKEYWIIPDQFL